MDRKKKCASEQFPFQATLGIICLGLYAGWSGRTVLLALAVAVLGGLIFWIVRTRQTALQRQAAEAAAAEEQVRAALPKVFASLVRPKAACLLRSRATLLTRDANGTIAMGRWLAELSRFYRDEIAPGLKHHFLGLGQPALVLRLGDEAAFLDWFLKSDPLKGADEDVAQGPPVPGMGPAEFDRWCGRMLCESGWSVRVVSEGGDLPATVLAEKDEVTLALQCRLDTRPPGAKTVQEAVAARDKHLSQVAAIVGNQPYAPAIQALARQQEVSLLHFSDLEGLEPSQLRGVAPPSRETAPDPEPEANRTAGPVPVFHRR